MSPSRACARWALALSVCLAAIHRAGAQDTVAAKNLPPIEIHGFIQVYYRSGDPLIKDGYRLRKADLKFTGFISPRLNWRISFDAGKVLTLSSTQTAIDDSVALTGVNVDQRTRMLQDAALTFRAYKYLALDVGQQIIPLSLEGTIPTSNVETVERTLFITEKSRAIGLGDIREVGASANGAYQGLEYHLGLFNETGEDAGTTDANDQKTVMARVAYHPPAFPAFQIGGSGGFQGGPTPQRRQRVASEIQYRDARLTLRGETMSARDGTLQRFGWYTLGAFRPTKFWQLTGRFDSWDRDRSGESSLTNALERQVTAGVSYLFDNTAKVAFNVVRQTFPNVSNVRDGTFGLLAFQAVW